MDDGVQSVSAWVAERYSICQREVRSVYWLTLGIPTDPNERRRLANSCNEKHPVYGSVFGRHKKGLLVTYPG